MIEGWFKDHLIGKIFSTPFQLYQIHVGLTDTFCLNQKSIKSLSRLKLKSFIIISAVLKKRNNSNASSHQGGQSHNNFSWAKSSKMSWKHKTKTHNPCIFFLLICQINNYYFQNMYISNIMPHVELIYWQNIFCENRMEKPAEEKSQNI